MVTYGHEGRVNTKITDTSGPCNNNPSDGTNIGVVLVVLRARARVCVCVLAC